MMTPRTLCALWQRGKAQLPLTPAERAMLKFLTATAVYALVSALLLLGQAVLAHGAISLSEVALVLLIVFLGSAASGIAKYATAHGDAQVGTALALLTDESVRAACLASGIDPTIASAVAAAVRGALATPQQVPQPIPSTSGASRAEGVDTTINRFGQ